MDNIKDLYSATGGILNGARMFFHNKWKTIDRLLDEISRKDYLIERAEELLSRTEDYGKKYDINTKTDEKFFEKKIKRMEKQKEEKIRLIESLAKQ